MPRPRNRVRINCAVCCKEFETIPSAIARGNKCCSQECFHKSRIGTTRPDLRKPPIEKECPVCKNKFQTSKNNNNKYFARNSRIFCSKQCRKKASYLNGSDCVPIERNDISYIAGMLDGEGSIMLIGRDTKRLGRSLSVRVTITNTNRDVLEFIKSKTGVGCISMMRKNTLSNQSCWSWAINSNVAISFLKKIYRFLIIKKKQARLVIAFQKLLSVQDLKYNKEWQAKWKEELQNLNHSSHLRRKNKLQVLQPIGSLNGSGSP